MKHLLLLALLPALICSAVPTIYGSWFDGIHSMEVLSITTPLRGFVWALDEGKAFIYPIKTWVSEAERIQWTEP